MKVKSIFSMIRCRMIWAFLLSLAISTPNWAQSSKWQGYARTEASGRERATLALAPSCFSDDFEDGNADGWSPQTPSHWEVRSDAGSLRYLLNTSNYDSPDGIRMGEISLVNDKTWDDFTFSCLAKSVDAAIGGEAADLCIAFGYQDNDSYYYVNFNSGAGLTQLHRIHNGNHVILSTYNQSTFSDGVYHALRIERQGNQIRAFFDGTEVITATDGFFGEGQIGVGSYNDSGFFDGIAISGSTCPSFDPYTEISAPLEGGVRSSAAWGDYDNDGDLDILLAGAAVGGYFAKIYRNDHGSFADIAAPLAGVTQSAVAWGDYDNDGDLDILLTGNDVSLNSIAKVYRNDNGSFIDIAAPLTGVGSGSVAWGDYDNDGDLDFLLTGSHPSSAGVVLIGKIYRNDPAGSGRNFVDSGIALEGVFQGAAVWGDYDNDGDLDVLLTGQSNSGFISKVYRNDGGNFVDIAAALIGLNAGSAAWGDYDSDGDLDILLTGFNEILNQRLAKIYRNDPAGSGRNFVDIHAALQGVEVSSAVWGDDDNDGDLDILLTGENESLSPGTKVYRNEDGQFIDIAAALTNVKLGAAVWGDYETDGDLDILLIGENASGAPVAKIYRNNIGVADEPPGTPANLVVAASANSVILSWNKATDSRTPRNALTYNLRVGTTPGGFEIVAPMADGVEGTRRVPALGNTNHCNSWTIKNLSPGTYYWSVQAIDNTFAGSPFATEQSFSLLTSVLKPEVPAETFVGAEFFVEVSISSVQNLFGVSFELDYTNTDFIDVVTPIGSSVVPGPFLGNDVVFISNVDETAGKVNIGITRKSGQGGVSGSGVLARVKFISRVTTPSGTQAVFSFSNVSATNASGNSIPLGLASATVSFKLNDIVVWPGDANNDRIVSQADVLPIGLYWSKTGPVRQNPNSSWTPQLAQPWAPQAATYADCNGDGAVNQGDVLPIGLNWGKTHSAAPLMVGNADDPAVSSKSNAATISITITGDTNPGQDFWIEVCVEQVTTCFGLSFELLYSPIALVDPQTAEAGSFLGNDVIFFPNLDKSAGRISIGITRKAGQGGVDGSGVVARIKMHVSNQAVRGQVVVLTLQDMAANDPAGQAIPLNVATSQPVVVSVASRPSESLPAAFALHPNAPNPFNPSTFISYDLADAAEVSVEIFDMLGKHVRTLVNARQQAGRYSVVWDGRNEQGQTVASGVFIYKLRVADPVKGGVGSFSQVRKMNLLR